MQELPHAHFWSGNAAKWLHEIQSVSNFPDHRAYKVTNSKNAINPKTRVMFQIHFEMRGLKLHSLRHTFATNLVGQGVDIYTVSRLLGHSDIKTTLIYAKANIATLEQAVKKLDKPEDGE